MKKKNIKNLEEIDLNKVAGGMRIALVRPEAEIPRIRTTGPESLNIKNRGPIDSLKFLPIENKVDS